MAIQLGDTAPDFPQRSTPAVPTSGGVGFGRQGWDTPG